MKGKPRTGTFSDKNTVNVALIIWFPRVYLAVLNLSPVGKICKNYASKKVLHLLASKGHVLFVLRFHPT